MDKGQIILFQTQGGETKLSLVEIHFLEAFEAEHKRLSDKK